MLAHIEVKEGNFKTAAQFIKKLLKLGVNFSYSIKKRAFLLLDLIYKKNNRRLTKNLKKISMSILRDESETPRNYILMLDYSKSMSGGGKIEHSVKALLKIWDEYIRPFDNVCFLKFNLNTYIDFNLQPKKINQFSKRYQIEQSTDPYERTSFYDALVSGLKQLLRQNGNYQDRESYMIIFCDGMDVSSKHTKHQAI